MDDSSDQAETVQSVQPERAAAPARPRTEKRFNHAQVNAHLRRHHPGCSAEVRKAIAHRVCERSWTGRTTLGAAVGITLQNFARHECTDYDTLLKRYGLKRDEARQIIREEVQGLLDSWRRKRLASPPQALEPEDQAAAAARRHGPMAASSKTREQELLLAGLPVDRVLACYARAPGNEIDSGKFASLESSAALAANTFGFFLDRARDLPALPDCEHLGWPAMDIDLEVILRFPWSGGKHPCLDAVVQTGAAVIGIESKRYEPFRRKKEARLSPAYWRHVWGDGMQGYMAMRDRLRDGTSAFAHLDAVQLVKHAFGLRTAVHRDGQLLGKRPVLFYLYAEPACWPDGRRIEQAEIEKHRTEVALFAAAVQDDEVLFVSCPYRKLLDTWSGGPSDELRRHAEAVLARFAPCGASA